MCYLLNTEKSLQNTPQQPPAPSRRRYLTLLLTSFLTVGAHVCYTMTSSIEQNLIESLVINTHVKTNTNTSV